jgi:predicted porin
MSQLIRPFRTLILILFVWATAPAAFSADPPPATSETQELRRLLMEQQRQMQEQQRQIEELRRELHGQNAPKALGEVASTTSMVPPNPLTISGVTTSATPEAVSITWTTNEPATSRIEWGTSRGALTANASDTNLVTVHTLSMTGLNPGTTYYVEITSVSAQGETVRQALGDTAKAAAPAESAVTPAVTAVPVTAVNRGYADVVNCASKPGSRQHCDADTSRGAVLLESTGDPACLLGRNWGYDEQGIWVANGCAGQFGSSNAKETNLARDFVGMFEPYGSLRSQVAMYQSTAAVQDDASRIGIRFATRGRIKVFAGTEWGVNLVRSSTSFNVDANAPGLIYNLVPETAPVFTARLGYLGVDFGPFGRFSAGKENAVHYDITSYTTDRFNSFGGQASATYVGSTDGGQSATGRADQVVQYHNDFLKILEVGLQTQFRGADTNHASNGWGASLQVKVLPGVKLGGSYTRTYWGEAARLAINGLGPNAEYIAFGARADWRFLELGAVWARQHSGDVAFIPASRPDLLPTPVAFNADGLELFGRAHLGPHFAIVGGFNDYRPDVTSPLINPDFKLRYFIAGGEWYVSKNAYLFTEGRIDNGTIYATGESGYNVLTVGFHYDFSLRLSHRQ